MISLILWIIGITLVFYVIPFLVINWCVFLMNGSEEAREYFMDRITKKKNSSTVDAYEYIKEVNPEVGEEIKRVTVDKLIKYIKYNSITPIFNIFLSIETAFIVLVKIPKYKQQNNN